ncbi:WSC domain-containing [Hyphodiscus hymeniophilus]|uniref:WSC domain-containing n=1 Tax=Hyphodiscus hymeniophilus TaxID=353542 RepID=A0A9P6VJZ7_9HELO|nr:WSC domain-containing [Hyphodiscus hymeniophilus]
MKLSYAAIVALFSEYAQAQFTWPSAYDELEDVMFLITGYRSRGFGTFVTPCSASPFVGRQTAAEWLRAGFHDMSTTNIYWATTATVHGGIDASLAYELNDGENIGAGFNSTFLTYAGFYNSQLPVSDLVALGVYASVRACGGPVIPMRGGRVDATAAGPMGVPQPQNGAGIFSNQFARMGFNNSAMIQMTACGHTLGGVHAGNFPTIVAPGTVANDYQLFDSTEEWDSLVASRYVNGPDTDPLAVGISTSSGRNSDFAVFNIDKNVTIKTMTPTDAFNKQCQAILQEMIEVVDTTLVTLSSVIVPYEVKPSGLQLTLLAGGTQLQFSGYIRVRTTTRSVTAVQLIYTDSSGNANAGTITASDAGTANGFDDSFEFYSFRANLPIASSISSFIITVSSNGLTQTYNNGGNGFPVSDSVIVQTPQSCIANGKLTVVAAVRSTVTTPVNMTVTQKVAQTAGSPITSPLPSLVSTSSIMTKGAAVGPYTLYSVSMTGVTVAGTKYGVSSGSVSDAFKDLSDLGTACAASPPVASSSTSTSASSTKTSTSTSTLSSVTPTLAVKLTIGAYSFQGCYTEGNGVRALAAGSYYNYTGMTLEQCASDCTGYNYWGVEYGGECYCGNTLAASSTLATLSDCSFTCPGNVYEYCGAGNRLEMYMLSSLSSSSSSVVSSTTSVSISSTSKTTSSVSLSSTKTSSTSTGSKTSSSSASVTASPTLAVKQQVGSYTFQGCWTEATNARALSGASYIDYNAMSLETCAANCAGWNYFGVEYGGECYCGTSPNTGSISTTLSDCSFTCPGNQYEYCGAGNRLEMYMRSSLTSSSSGSLRVLHKLHENIHEQQIKLIHEIEHLTVLHQSRHNLLLFLINTHPNRARHKAPDRELHLLFLHDRSDLDAGTEFGGVLQLHVHDTRDVR